MAVLSPLKVVITNYPRAGRARSTVPYNPEDKTRAEQRPVPFSRELYIERDDFMEDPPKKFFRLAPETRGAAARRLLHRLHRRGEGRSGQHRPSCAAVYDPATQAAARRPTAAR
jgi:glutamyl/glutaminyl-tRNA synthetase